MSFSFRFHLYDHHLGVDDRLYKQVTEENIDRLLRGLNLKNMIILKFDQPEDPMVTEKYTPGKQSIPQWRFKSYWEAKDRARFQSETWVEHLFRLIERNFWSYLPLYSVEVDPVHCHQITFRQMIVLFPGRSCETEMTKIQEWCEAYHVTIEKNFKIEKPIDLLNYLPGEYVHYYAPVKRETYLLINGYNEHWIEYTRQDFGPELILDYSLIQGFHEP